MQFVPQGKILRESDSVFKVSVSGPLKTNLVLENLNLESFFG